MEDDSSDEEPEQLQCKIILLGDGAVGKTSIALRYDDDDDDDDDGHTPRATRHAPHATRAGLEGRRCSALLGAGRRWAGSGREAQPRAPGRVRR